MSIKISSLKKNEDFKSLLSGRKINNKYLTIFFKKLSNKNNKKLRNEPDIGDLINIE